MFWRSTVFKYTFGLFDQCMHAVKSIHMPIFFTVIGVIIKLNVLHRDY